MKLYALVKLFHTCTGKTRIEEVTVGVSRRNLEDAGQEWMGDDDTGSYTYDIVPVTLSPEIVDTMGGALLQEGGPS